MDYSLYTQRNLVCSLCFLFGWHEEIIGISNINGIRRQSFRCGNIIKENLIRRTIPLMKPVFSLYPE